MSNKVISPSAAIDKFFKSCGIGGTFKPDQFWRLLHKRFGPEAKEFNDCITSRESGIPKDPYRIKNSSLEFSNAISAQYDCTFIKSFAIWIINEGIIKDGNILEVGCENGILLCLLASLYPNSNFTGIDVCDEAISVANRRAKALNLDNVIFLAGPIEKTAELISGNIYSTILASKVFHEVLFGILSERPGRIDIGSIGEISSIDEMDLSIKNKIFQIPELEVLCEVISDDGLFVSVDRWSRAEITLLWVRMLEAKGLNLSLTHSNLISHKCHMDLSSGEEALPVTVFSKIFKGPKKACDILAYQGHKEYSKIYCHTELLGNVAELTFGAINSTDIYEQVNVYHDGSGTLYTNIGFSGGLVYFYLKTSKGYRKLTLIPGLLLNEIMPRFFQEREDSELYSDVSYRWIDKEVLDRFEVDEGLILDKNV